MKRGRSRWIIVVAVMALVVSGSTAWASFLTPQTPFPGQFLTKFLDPMPVFGPGTNGVDAPNAHPRLSGDYPVTVTYVETSAQDPLPIDFPYPAVGPLAGKKTYVWGYQLKGKTIDPNTGAASNFTSPAHWPGFTIEAHVGTPTDVTYVNSLPYPAFLQDYLTIDQSIHWANPFGAPKSVVDPITGTFIANPNPYSGPIPVVTHLHGAEVPSEYDGVPDQWFTPTGITGPLYRTKTMVTGNNGAEYEYPNEQQATTLWYHDHGLGITRLNVYAGLAAFYLLRDQYDTGKEDNPLTLPGGPYEMEMVIQDRQFDANGQLLFPDGSPPGLNGPPPNPAVHQFWNPEFFGDTIAVNGEVWPFLQVEARRYRFRVLNGSNARMYRLKIGRGSNSLPFYVIGTDGGLLDAPVMVKKLFIAPGERYDVIVDFSSRAGKRLLVTNNANAPFPGGDAPDPQTNGQVMQFRVKAAAAGFVDPTFDPSVPGATLRGGADQPPAIERLVDPATGTAAVTPDVKRQLVLREIEGPGGPIEVLLNNSKWTGIQEGFGTPIPGAVKAGPNYITELPQVGSTEEWTIINTTGDAHPIHLHLVQFQLENRQRYRANRYVNAYFAAYPGGQFIAGYGPPNDYFTPNADGALGGNPAVSSYLLGTPSAPHPWEAGWKDTVVMLPGQVSRIMVRFAPQAEAIGSTAPGTNYYGFDPTTPTGLDASGQAATVVPGYVWHCHILDHEDNEMMRPYTLVK